MAIVVAPEVEDALHHGGAVVALESTIISHGLPRPDNLIVAGQVEAAVRSAGAVPATVAIVDGVVRLGLDRSQLSTIADADDVAKVSVRDLATVVARRGHGAATVAATSHLAHRAGIRVFATGGLGGVHRGAGTTFDESADLVTLGRTGITVVCAGVKSILDVSATLERLETLGIAVLGMGTDQFPGFYLRDSGYAVDARVESPEEVAAIMAARAEVGTDTAALIVANPLPAADAMDPARHDALLTAGLAAADAAGVRGKDVTPFLLDWFHRESHGESLRANVAIILRNADLAARIAVARAPVTDEVLVIGDLMVDVVVRPAGPIQSRSDTASSIELHGGGSAANTACWLAAIGRQVRLVAAVGDDALGRLVLEELEAAGVAFAGQVVPGRATGTCVVLVDDEGERTMLPDRGANEGLAPDVVDAAVARRPTWLHLSGYALLGSGSRPAARSAMGQASRVGVPWSVDASSAAPLRAVGPDGFLTWIDGCALLLANDDECQALGGEATALGAAREMVTKHGALGASWTDGRTSVHVPPPPVEVVSAVGAGDAFDAGYLDARLSGSAPEAALTAGARLAAQALARAGARP